MSDSHFERTPATFEELYEAVTGTPRGRWFVDEFARRNRSADTEAVLLELARIEASMKEMRSHGGVPDWREEAQAIVSDLTTAQSVAQIAADGEPPIVLAYAIGQAGTVIAEIAARLEAATDETSDGTVDSPDALKEIASDLAFGAAAYDRIANQTRSLLRALQQAQKRAHRLAAGPALAAEPDDDVTTDLTQTNVYEMRRQDSDDTDDAVEPPASTAVND